MPPCTGKLAAGSCCPQYASGRTVALSGYARTTRTVMPDIASEPSSRLGRGGPERQVSITMESASQSISPVPDISSLVMGTGLRPRPALARRWPRYWPRTLTGSPRPGRGRRRPSPGEHLAKSFELSCCWPRGPPWRPGIRPAVCQWYGHTGRRRHRATGESP